jgi:hypothetical protein
MCILIVKLLRSTYDVLICSLSGLPIFGCFSEPMHFAGL